MIWLGVQNIVIGLCEEFPLPIQGVILAKLYHS